MTFSKQPEKFVCADKIHTFQETVGTPFVALLKENSSSRFANHDIVSALAIFDPRNVPSTDSSQFPIYGKKSIEVLLNRHGKDKFALTLNDEETVKTAVISPEVHTEWITFHTLLAKKLKDSIALQLKELITNEILVTMFPNLQKLVPIGLTLPVSTASVERSFSQMKQIKTRLRNSLTEGRLTQLMRISIESPDQLT